MNSKLFFSAPKIFQTA